MHTVVVVVVVVDIYWHVTEAAGLIVATNCFDTSTTSDQDIRATNCFDMSTSSDQDSDFLPSQHGATDTDSGFDSSSSSACGSEMDAARFFVKELASNSASVQGYVLSELMKRSNFEDARKIVGLDSLAIVRLDQVIVRRMQPFIKHVKASHQHQAAKTALTTLGAAVCGNQEEGDDKLNRAVARRLGLRCKSMGKNMRCRAAFLATNTGDGVGPLMAGEHR